MTQLDARLIGTNPMTLKDAKLIAKDTKARFGVSVFVAGNVKLGKDIPVFNLPSGYAKDGGTCRPTKWCATNCYMAKLHKAFPKIKASNAKRLQISKALDFPERALAELVIWRNRVKHQFPVYVRLHADGDFYSAQYVHCWVMINQLSIRNELNMRFLAFTKSINLVLQLSIIARLDGFSLYESCDESRPKMHLSFANKAYVQDAKPVHVDHKDNKPCPGSCIDCKACWQGWPVLFHKH